jgi:fatty-acyl-CoA synthase
MAALVTEEGFDLGMLATRIAVDLPEYARPAFIRLQPEMEVTGTFKQRKVQLVAEGFDPAKVAQPLFHRAADGGYRPLDAVAHEGISTGRIRI